MIYQHLPTISEKINWKTFCASLLGTWGLAIDCLGKFSFSSPMSNSISLPWQEDSVDEAEVEVGTFQPPQIIQVVLELPSKPIHLSHALPSYIGHPGDLRLPNFNECIFWLTNLGACRLQCQCQVHVTKWRLGLSPDIFSTLRLKMVSSQFLLFSDGGLILLFGGFILWMSQ